MDAFTTPSRTPFAAPMPLRQVAPGLPFVLAQGRLLHLAPALPGDVAARRPPTPWCLQVEAGAVWVTWPGCGDDVFLGAGEQAEVPGGVAVLVEVEPRLWRGAARLCLVCPPCQSGLAAWWARLARLARSGWSGRVLRRRRPVPAGR